ncbi:hypothetical protein ACHAAC_09740 [Aeromicrobium sp. CF4.19]|uniref:hypothetical protein n=1 Tax=Aeromicrobium sp. CF4.19 TaxID=3373082 RepID=UPI003EE6A52A
MNHLRQVARILRTDGAVAAVAVLLTVTVAGLFAMHPLSAWHWGDRGIWDIWLEAGMLSLFGWAMWFWGMLLAIALSVRERAWSLLVWAVILALLLYDDAEEFHELLARRLATELFPGMPTLSELLAFAAVGSVCLAIALAGTAVARPATRGVHTALVLILATGVFFGVGADAIQNLVGRESSWWLPVTLVEQMGEAMTSVAIVVAFIAWIGHGIDPAHPGSRALVQAPDRQSAPHA